MFQFVEQAQKNQSNPQEILNQITKNYKPEQMKALINSAKKGNEANLKLDKDKSNDNNNETKKKKKFC